MRAEREGGAVIIHVGDNGPGVPERSRANLFAAFQGSARTGGTGLGLPVAAELVGLHGGAIDARGHRGRRLLPDRAFRTAPERASPAR